MSDRSPGFHCLGSGAWVLQEVGFVFRFSVRQVKSGFKAGFQFALVHVSFCVSCSLV